MQKSDPNIEHFVTMAGDTAGHQKWLAQIASAMTSRILFPKHGKHPDLARYFRQQLLLWIYQSHDPRVCLYPHSSTSATALIHTPLNLPTHYCSSAQKPLHLYKFAQCPAVIPAAELATPSRKALVWYRPTPESLLAT